MKCEGGHIVGDGDGIYVHKEDDLEKKCQINQYSIVQTFYLIFTMALIRQLSLGYQ